MAGGRELYDKRVVPCIKCPNSKLSVIHHDDGHNTEVFVRCECGEEGPHTSPLKNPDEHMDYTVARAVRSWNRENIPKATGHLDEADPRYPGHVV